MVKTANDCGTFECPDCRTEFGPDGKITRARGWEHREAVAISRRVTRARVERYEHGRPIHVVVSPPQDMARELAQGLRGYRRLRTKAVREARRAGFRGGALVYHHLRVGDRWDNKREGKCVEGPHFHGIGYGWLRGTDEALERNGWVVWNLGTRKNDDPYSTALYVLSHATRPRKAGYPARERSTGTYLATAATWFGTLSYNAMPRRADDEEEPHRFCPLCDKNVPLGQWLGVEYREDDPPDAIAELITEPERWTVVSDGYQFLREWYPYTLDQAV